MKSSKWMGLVTTVSALWVLGAVTGQVTMGKERPGLTAPPKVLASTVLHEGHRKTRTSPSGKATIEVLSSGVNAFVGILTLAPNAEVPIHRDESEEHIYILEGSGVMVIDGQSQPLKKGSSVLMPAGAEVSFRNGSEVLKGLQVFSGVESVKKYDSWVE